MPFTDTTECNYSHPYCLSHTHTCTHGHSRTHTLTIYHKTPHAVSHTHTLLQIQVDISLSYIHICALHTCPIYCHVNTHSCYLFPSHRYPPQGMAQMLIWFVYPEEKALGKRASVESLCCADYMLPILSVCFSPDITHNNTPCVYALQEQHTITHSVSMP